MDFFGLPFILFYYIRINFIYRMKFPIIQSMHLVNQSHQETIDRGCFWCSIFAFSEFL